MNNQKTPKTPSPQTTQNTQNTQTTPNTPITPTPPHTFLPRHGHYRNLRVYKVTEIIYDITYYFTHKFLSRGDRTVDQMIQAARSGKQNIAEGNQAAATSSETEIKLTNVAKASLEELLDDGSDGSLVLALDGDLDGLAALDAQLHQSHQTQDVGGLLAAMDNDGGLVLAGFLVQHAGGTGVDANGLSDNILKANHGKLLLKNNIFVLEV